MFIVLQVGRDGMTEKVIHNFSFPPHMPKPSQSILLLLDYLKAVTTKNNAAGRVGLLYIDLYMWVSYCKPNQNINSE